jgi:predicted ATPase
MVACLSDELDRRHHLVRAQGILRMDSQRLSRYRFRHILFQRYLYHSLDKVERIHLHEDVGNVLEKLYETQTEEIAIQLARHFQQAGITAKAIHYLHQAGNEAVRLSANEEAIAHFTKGLDLLKTLPDTPERASQELRLQMALSAPLMVAKGFASPELGHACARARALCKQVGETPQLFPVLWHLGSFYSMRAEYQTALELCDQMLSLAERAEDAVLIALARWGLGYGLVRTGALAPGLAHLEHMIAFYDSQQHHALTFTYGSDPGVACLSWASWALWMLGYPDQALKRSEEALVLAHNLSHPPSLVFAQGVAGYFYLFRQDGQTAQALIETGLNLATEHSLPFWVALLTYMEGWVLVEQGRSKAGVEQMRRGLDAYESLGTEDIRSMMLTQLAEAYGKLGQIEEGLTTLSEALAFVEKTGECFYEAEIHRLQGELLLKEQALREVEGMKDERVVPEAYLLNAETCFQRAVEVARRQQAKLWELRAVMSLCRLLKRQDRQKKARILLTEIYGRFTEGLDTPDLQEAKTILTEL